MSENKPRFQKLTPIRDADIGIYSDALDCVFADGDLRNVAVSGAYSAGKSSILESYKAKQTDKKFLHISLAHFEEAGEISSDEPTRQAKDKPVTVKESVLEGKILNQLIHQITPSRIPQTNFRVKQKVEPKKIVLWTVSIVVFILSLLHVMFLRNWQGYVNSILTEWVKTILGLTAKNSSVLLTGLTCAVLAGFFLYHVIKAQVNKGIFKKISADKFEIEIFEGSDDSYFDKYLNEVLYLFDQCEADVIVFEDMDRYNANRIFERLREVNTLVNVQKAKKSGNKPLRFFYLLRDDIFVSKDRTKFFDFIIPVVPVVDGSNSYDQFIKHLTDSGAFGLFDEPFLQGLSLYVDDMRILKNICNEFLIYNSRLNITELNHNKLMAMIAYKNLFPRDFSDLQLGRGFVFTLFDQREQFIASMVTKLSDKISVLKRRIENAENEHLKSLQELDLIKASKKQEIENNTRNYSYNTQQNQQRQAAFRELEEEYASRRQAIEDRDSHKIPSIEEDIRQLEIEIARKKKESLRNVITRENIDEIFSVTSKNEIDVVNDFKDVRGNICFALLKYLIRNGYIDESYADYMTYFYEQSLSRTDKIFLRSIANQEKKEPDYSLTAPGKIVARLDSNVFDQPEVLNYDLLFYLLKVSAIYMKSTKASGIDVTEISSTPLYSGLVASSRKEEKMLCVMMEQITSQRNNKFLQDVFLSIRDERLNYLVNMLNAVHKEWFERLAVGNVEFASSCKEEFVFRTLIVTPDDDLLGSESIKSALASYISNHESFLDAKWLNEELLVPMFGESYSHKAMRTKVRAQLLARFNKLEVRFHAIKHDTIDAKLFEQVYKQSLYEPNFGNIVLMLKTQYGLEESDDFKHKNFSLIKAQPDTPIAAYVAENINDYLVEILENCNG
ncbi:MAG: hypothetical protein FWD25_06365, partial [Clostridia bacterium]|nr:hypothetical protein [Clostridia bacterium]